MSRVFTTRFYISPGIKLGIRHLRKKKERMFNHKYYPQVGLNLIQT